MKFIIDAVKAAFVNDFDSDDLDVESDLDTQLLEEKLLGKLISAS